MSAPLLSEDGAWCCLRSQPRHEHVAAANLRRHSDIQVFNPRIRFKRATRRGPVWVTESLFPSYLFARFDWSTMLRDVMHTFGVAAVVHFGPFWPTLSEAVMGELRDMVGGDELRVIGSTLKVGDQVEIAGGAFDGFRGVVTQIMPARERVAVLLDFLGRPTKTEVKISAVTRDKSEYVARRI